MTNAPAVAAFAEEEGDNRSDCRDDEAYHNKDTGDSAPVIEEAISRSLVPYHPDASRIGFDVSKGN